MLIKITYVLNLYNGKCCEGKLYGAIKNKCLWREVHGIMKTQSWEGRSGKEGGMPNREARDAQSPLGERDYKHLKS